MYLGKFGEAKTKDQFSSAEFSQNGKHFWARCPEVRGLGGTAPNCMDAGRNAEPPPGPTKSRLPTQNPKKKDLVSQILFPITYSKYGLAF
jgi:hypothetical protein